MAAAASSISPSSIYPSKSLQSPFSGDIFIQQPFKRRTYLRLQASRRPQEGDRNNWNRNRIDMTFAGDYDDEEDEDDDEDEDDEEDERILDLLIRFVENVFKKVSKRARKSVRSVLPVNIPTKLVGFSVNGVIILAFFWILKAFLEVVCTLGTVVFVSILVVRGVWTGISYFQDGRTNNFDDGNQAWNGTQPVP
ncbi:uncharacterized protein LOC143630582 [Bidens hawaiensis]|uniref:uncharacterized protein LOC143630582 n=1 Tax=Bidens hawaiensis TaxID=980011 RepID=UPI00404B497E